MIINAEGKHFCAGHYLAEMITGGVKEYKSIFEECTRMMQLIHEIPQPVIAQVQGVATAAGCQMVAWCDLAVAETGARFATPGVRIGLFCTTPMVAITRAIGRKAAMEMLLTGRFFSAREAKDLGLVNRVVSPENLASETMEMAKLIAESSGFVLALGKKAFYAQVDQPDEKALAYATNTIAMNLTAEDAQLGIRAFLEKKKPEWKNR
jgi:enoyl-CoA hydratase/carnithine racemase